MRRIVAGAVALGMLGAGPAAAQEIMLAPGETLLKVEGEGVHRGAPDRAAISAGVVTTGATAREALAADAPALVEEWAGQQKFDDNARQGALIFAGSGCLNCHTYLDAGSSNLGAPVLTAEGAKNKGIEFQIEHLKCPSCTTPGSQMPPFANLPEEDLRALAVFLEASKGPQE